MKSHCNKGHAYTPENTYFYQGLGRYCKACIKLINDTVRQTPEYKAWKKTYNLENRYKYK